MEVMELKTGYPPSTRGKVIVWGQMAAAPFGGMIWQVLHYLAALRQWGYDAWYVEDSDRLVFDPVTYDVTSDYSRNLQILHESLASIGLADRWVFRPPSVYDRCEGGLDRAGLLALYRDAEAAINLCGSQEVREEHAAIRCRIYLETDPARNQVAVASGDAKRIEELASYDHLFTYGENLNAEDCRVPIERFRWRTTRPPVVVDWWSTSGPPPTGAALTSVANWKHSGNDVVWKGEAWRWSKHYEFERFIALPRRSSLPLRLAVGAISGQERDRLHLHGWETLPSATLEEAGKYRSFIQSSLGEFTVAKEQYVLPRTGWFSDRSVCYLAAGRPVVMQDTGFGKFTPTGEGLFAYETEDQALAAIEAIRSDYAGHSRAAQAIASEYYDAKRLVGDLLRQVGLL
jgi:hypothetical protein